MKTDERENKYISVDQVIELACDIASRDLESYWKEHYSNKEIDLEKDGERRYSTIIKAFNFQFLAPKDEPLVDDDIPF